jgi:hypothetical protein
MINKLIENIKKTNAPIVVGLDPMLNYIPQHIQKKAFSELGETLEGAAEAIWQYNKGIVDAISDLIPAVKPQIAMYEQFGIPGLMAYKNTIDYCKEKGLLLEISNEVTLVPHLLHMQSDIWVKFRWEVTESQVLTKILRQSIHIWDLTVSTRLSMYVKKRTKGFLYS